MAADSVYRITELVGTSNKIRVFLDWTLDLLIERSITQIGYSSRAPAEPPGPSAPPPS